MNVEEFQEEKLCARCGHSEGRHKTAGGFCKHCPCDGFVEEKEHTDGKIAGVIQNSTSDCRCDCEQGRLKSDD